MNTARILYALMTWLYLWGFAGGDAALFWQRLPFLAVGTAGLAVAALWAYPAEARIGGRVTFTPAQLRRLWLLEPTRAPAFQAVETLPADASNYTEGVRLKWALLPLGLLALLLAAITAFGRGEGAVGWIASGVASFATRDVILVLSLIVFAVAAAFLMIALLQREWGTGNVIFLMAVTLGFASQMAGVFAVAAVVGGIFALLAERVNIITSLVGAGLWFTFFFLVLGYMV